LKINPYALFLRKVNYKFPDEKLIEISSWDVDINKPDINKQNINKQIVYKITQIKNYNVLALYFILFLFFTICFAKIFMNA